MQKITKLDSFPSNFESYDAIFIFSGAVSKISEQQMPQLLNYVEQGHGIYCGADNSPLQEEFNQFSEYFFAKKVWGNFTTSNALISTRSFITNDKSDSINAGETTVAVPLDPRVKVEAWIEDEPIITSLNFGKGKIIFDGGYSRFFCNQKESSDNVMEEIIQFLIK